jgi:peptidoglycan/xylan/chitin deacetylase (PgdA/CDA1 family)
MIQVIGLRRIPMRIRQSPVIWGFHDVPDSAWFERCVRDIVSSWQVLPLMAFGSGGRRPGTCAITFDDGLRSVVDVAAPILDAYELPYTIFVCTDVLSGGPVPWFLRVSRLIDSVGMNVVRGQWSLVDRRFRSKHDIIVGMKQIPISSILAGLDELERRHDVRPPEGAALFASVTELRRLATSNATIGSHTHRHATLSVLPTDEQRREIEVSVERIKALFGTPPREFAYPNGTPIDFDTTTVALVRQAGLEVAVTTTQRHLRSQDDPLALPRIGLTSGDSYPRRVAKVLVPSASTTNARERALRSRVVVG